MTTRTKWSECMKPAPSIRPILVRAGLGPVPGTFTGRAAGRRFGLHKDCAEDTAALSVQRLEPGWNRVGVRVGRGLAKAELPQHTPGLAVIAVEVGAKRAIIHQLAGERRHERLTISCRDGQELDQPADAVYIGAALGSLPANGFNAPDG